MIELRNIATVAGIIIASALRRKESRGLHYTIDYPKKVARLAQVDTIIKVRPRISAVLNRVISTAKARNKGKPSRFSLFSTVRKEEV